MKRMNTPGGSAAGAVGGIVVPLNKKPNYTRYTGNIKIRTETLEVAFGTAAFDLAIISNAMRCPAFGGTTLGGLIRVDLFDGFGKGDRCWDITISFGGITQKSDITAILKEVEGFSPHNTADGIFPLTWAGNQLRPAYAPTKSIMERIIADHRIEPVFAFAHRFRKRRAGKGELHLGIIKDNYIDHRDHEYHDCVPDSPFWIVDSATITIGDYKVENVRTIFDTASRLVHGPEHKVSEIYKHIKKPFEKHGSGVYTSSYIDMRKNVPDITFQWGTNGKRWKITSDRFGQGAAPQENRVIGLFAPHTEFTARLSPRPPARPMEPQPENKPPPPYIQKVPGPLPMHAATERPPHLRAPGSVVVLQFPELQSVQPKPDGNDWIIPFPVMEAIGYVTFDRRNGKCRIGMSSLPSEILKV
ncbi:hypothetical protein F5887DRAFT_174111 [Amanita rubescens]|nr:hypothetical protein F5887DRAFT_174111 [Amanita rubescens]